MAIFWGQQWSVVELNRERKFHRFNFLCNRDCHLHEAGRAKIGKISQCSPLWNDHRLPSKQLKSIPFTYPDHIRRMTIQISLQQIP